MFLFTAGGKVLLLVVCKNGNKVGQIRQKTIFISRHRSVSSLPCLDLKDTYSVDYRDPSSCLDLTDNYFFVNTDPCLYLSRSERHSLLLFIQTLV